jgi:glycosyltransferase involved in cell wall biosynthesis
VPPGVRYTGELERGIVVINGLSWRGRRLGRDIFESLRERVPLDLVGMQSDELGGLGEVVPRDVPAFASRYRFFFHPARYTSLGLAVLEAMAVGMPVVGLATTELVTVIENGVNGYIATDPEALVEPMQRLLADPVHARRLGEAARETATDRFGIDRFAKAWDAVLQEAVGADAALVAGGTA